MTLWTPWTERAITAALSLTAQLTTNQVFLYKYIQFIYDDNERTIKKNTRTSITQIANKPNPTHQHTRALAAKTLHVRHAHAHHSCSHVTVLIRKKQKTLEIVICCMRKNYTASELADCWAIFTYIVALHWDFQARIFVYNAVISLCTMPRIATTTVGPKPGYVRSRAGTCSKIEFEYLVSKNIQIFEYLWPEKLTCINYFRLLLGWSSMHQYWNI